MNSANLGRFSRKAYRFVRSALTTWKRELVIRREGLELTFATRSPVAKRWFYPRYASGRRLHEPPVARLIASRLNPSSIFYDVGANLGFFTVLAANVCNGSQGGVHAFEMDPDLIPLVRASVDKNPTAGPVCLTCVACSDEVGGFARFRADQESNPSTNRLRPSSLADRTGLALQIPTTTIDHYWEQTGATPNLIKMDIEGAEAIAVPHMTNLVESHAPEIILEVHPIKIETFGVDPLQIVDHLLAAGGYTLFEIGEYRTHRASPEDALTPFQSARLSRTEPTVLFFSRDETLSEAIAVQD